MTGPGSRVRAYVARWCSAQTMERLIDPVLADLQTEYDEARARGQSLRSLWIWIAGHVALGKVLTLHGSARAIEMMTNMSVEERQSVMRTFGWAFAAIIAVTALLAAAPLRDELSRSREDALTLILLLVPQALPISIPVGLVVAILQALRHGTVTRASRMVILGLAMVLCVGSFATVAWVIPETNQAYREMIVRRMTANDGTLAAQTLARGPGELTWSQLRRAAAEQSPEFALRPESRRYPAPNFAYVYYMRWAISFTPLVLALFALVVATRLTRSRVIRWLVACAVVFAYWTISFLGDRGFDVDRTLPMIMAWTPNLAILLLTAALAKLARPRIPAAA